MAINPADITTIRVGELPTGEIGTLSKFPMESGTTLYQITGQDLIDFININSNAFQFEQKTLHVNQAYIDNNFDETGLGTNLCLGWAICNGNNGTPPLDGLVEVGYGTNYDVIGGFGGEKEHTLIENEMPVHTHGGVALKTNDADRGTGSSLFSIDDVGVTLPAGLGDPHNNMQPYIIALKIMKL